MSKYTCFVRNWWYRGTDGKLHPHPGARKTTVRRGLTYNEARQFCQEYNATHNPGPLSRKCEFTAE